ncbi:hypothetical protein GP486_001218 [Trichoglossum hirsutum]|uniref:Putative gamma-glutamylcyclotransferase n=1 Tax=Trichoglossum hirsutum TaxID=265104 RepID=A0A9P8LHJ6_9PEZI|nr:hypothetical protein GP486_001218 [Trichoglossum hirsutum]
MTQRKLKIFFDLRLCSDHLHLQKENFYIRQLIMSGKENLPPSIMARRFLNARPFPDQNLPPPAFRKQFYFFYGTLMDPTTLARVLNLRERPVLLPAKIIGYHCMLWGPYPALLDGPGGAAVHGMAYEIQSPNEVKLLEDYETGHYENNVCLISFEDGTKVVGRTFKWRPGKGDLKEGFFDLRGWQMKDLERDI